MRAVCPALHHPSTPRCLSPKIFNLCISNVFTEIDVVLPVSGMAPVSRFARPRTLAMTFWGEFGPPKKAPPSLENRADSPPLAAPSEDATVHTGGTDDVCEMG